MLEERNEAVQTSCEREKTGERVPEYFEGNSSKDSIRSTKTYILIPTRILFFGISKSFHCCLNFLISKIGMIILTLRRISHMCYEVKLVCRVLGSYNVLHTLKIWRNHRNIGLEESPRGIML